MKLKSILFAGCFSLVSNVFAVNLHMNSNANAADQKEISQNTLYPGYCEIELINDSYSNVRVYGTFDDGAGLDFRMYSYEDPHYIDLFYYGYCHRGMYITIETAYNTVYDGWVNTGTSIRIVPWLVPGVKKDANQQVKVEISNHK